MPSGANDEEQPKLGPDSSRKRYREDTPMPPDSDTNTIGASPTKRTRTVATEGEAANAPKHSSDDNTQPKPSRLESISQMNMGPPPLPTPRSLSAETEHDSQPDVTVYSGGDERSTPSLPRSPVSVNQDQEATASPITAPPTPRPHYVLPCDDHDKSAFICPPTPRIQSIELDDDDYDSWEEGEIKALDSQPQGAEKKHKKEPLDLIQARIRLQVMEEVYRTMVEDQAIAVDRLRASEQALESDPSSSNHHEEDKDDENGARKRRDQATAKLVQDTEAHLAIKMSLHSIQDGRAAAELEVHAVESRGADTQQKPPTSPPPSPLTSLDDNFEDGDKEEDRQRQQQQQQQQPKGFRIVRPVLALARERVARFEAELNAAEHRRSEAAANNLPVHIMQELLDDQRECTGKIRVAKRTLKEIEAIAAKADAWDEENNNTGADRVPNPYWKVDKHENVNCTGMTDSKRNVNCHNLTKSSDNVNCQDGNNLWNCVVSVTTRLSPSTLFNSGLPLVRDPG